MNLKKARPGDLDPDFGDNGQVIFTSPDVSQFTPWAINVDSEQRIYVAGQALRAGVGNQYFCLRLTSNGEPDKDFGQAGYVFGTFGGDISHRLREVLVQKNDNKPLLISTSGQTKAVMRLNLDGNRDLSYGKDGVAIIPTGANMRSDEVETAASGTGGTSHSTLLSDGKLLLIAEVWVGSSVHHSLVVRLNTDGTLDNQFGEQGITRVRHPDFDGTLLLGSLELELENERKYLLSGAVLKQGQHDRALFMRLLPSGKLDTSFADEGYKVVLSEFRTGFYPDKLILQTNHRLLGVGHTYDARDAGLLIRREMDGSENIQFNGGRPLLESNGALRNKWTNALIQNDGKILVHGSTLNAQSGEDKNAVARYTDDGQLDTSFGISFPVRQAYRPAAWFTGNTVLFLGTIKVDETKYVHCIARGVIA